LIGGGVPASSFATPKSMIFGRPKGRTTMFGGFDVPVHDVLAMGVIERLGDAGHDAQRLPPVGPSAVIRASVRP
jgi:hypothetical protein